ncbi:HIRAN domain [Paraburkholderia caribensis MBA4]|uniref:HIRAN domain n=1 Tax=Paraburkholderia caribensis MBA4 TaxID=1323664 RepID=A0A0P0RBQ3_9BURK|nr:HIRAN domain-containing protein [Paraburkholderia caribensis]ALL65775.1 HIRAN domain [Paraburkholderia caribensis MBA4]
MKQLFVAWQQPTSREWIPVARLEREDHVYRFLYTQGARRADGFRPFGNMTELDSVYFSDTLFPFFSNRLLAKSRPEYRDYLSWMNIDASASDPMSMLAITGGLRGTDSLELFPMPTRTEAGKFEIEFFARGLRHFNQSCVLAVNALETNDRLCLVRDLQNKADAYALFMRTENPIHLVGYVPRFYAKDLGILLERFPVDVEVRVQRVNPDAPLSMRLLCSVSAPWPEDFVPFENDADFAPMTHLPSHT